jgi:hypothetical protein
MSVQRAAALTAECCVFPQSWTSLWIKTDHPAPYDPWTAKGVLKQTQITQMQEQANLYGAQRRPDSRLSPVSTIRSPAHIYCLRCVILFTVSVVKQNSLQVARAHWQTAVVVLIWLGPINLSVARHFPYSRHIFKSQPEYVLLTNFHQTTSVFY